MKTELEILRELAQHYAENGYSKAIKALKQIEDNKKAIGIPKKLSLRNSFALFLADFKASRIK
jgi:hypothetical protein